VLVPVFATPISVSPGETPNNEHGGITTLGDEIHVCWEGSSVVRYMKSADEGQNFSSPITIGGATDEIPLTKCIAVDGLNVYVLYAINSRNAGAKVQLKMVRSTDGGTSFGSEVTLDNGASWANDRFLRVAMIAQNGDVHILYSSEDSSTHVGSPLYYLRSTTAGASLDSRTTVGSGTGTTRPDLCVVGNTLHAAWTDDRNGTLTNGGDAYYNRSDDNGSTWNGDQKVSNTVFHSTARSTITAEGQNIIYGYQYPGNGDPNVVMIQTSGDNGANWSTATIVADGTSEQEHPTVVCQAGVTMLVYTNWDTTPHSTYAIVSLDYGASWGAAAQAYVPGSDSAAPLVVVSTRFACVMDRQNATDGLQMVRSPVFESDPSAALLDNFNRGSLGSNWTTPGVLTANPQLVIASNQLCRDSSGSYRQGGYWNAGTFTDVDMIAELSALTADANDGFAMFARLASPGGAGVDGYGALIAYDGSEWEWTQTVITNAATPATNVGFFAALTSSDQICIRLKGNLFLLWQKTGGVWAQVGVVIDDTYASAGFIGMEFLNDQDTKVTNLYAQEIVEEAAMAWVTTL
jgi:BNR repeat-like domain